MTLFRCISIDAPWAECGGGGRGANQHYSTIKRTSDIFKTIVRADVWNPHPDGCHFWVWYTDNYLCEALALLHMLDARYIRTFQWAKIDYRIAKPGVRSREKLQEIITLASTLLDGTSEGPRHLDAFARAIESVLSFGQGQYGRGAHEGCLFGVRGRLAPQQRDQRSLLVAPLTSRHSEKPESFFERIEAISPGPRLEMFCREEPRTGWVGWGDQAT